MIGARAVVLGAPFEIAAPLLAERGIPVVTIAEMDAGTPVDPLPTDEQDIALQQLTSGSTGSRRPCRSRTRTSTSTRTR